MQFITAAVKTDFGVVYAVGPLVQQLLGTTNQFLRSFHPISQRVNQSF